MKQQPDNTDKEHRPNHPNHDEVKKHRKPLNRFGYVAGYSALHAWKVVAGWLVLALVGLVLAVTNLKVDTDPGKMISQDLPFRQAFLDFVHAFPSSDNNFLVVVEADDGKLARAASAALVESFKARKDLFVDVYAPGLGPFFDQYGILYLPEQDIQNIARNVKASATLIKVLSQQPNFVGLAALLDAMKPALETGRGPSELAGFLREIKKTILLDVKGNPKPLDWSAIVTGGVEKTPKRWFISVKPELDFSQLDPSEAALSEARKIIKDREITRSGAVKISLTGEAALNGEEFSAVTTGAIRAGIVSFFLVTLVIWLGMPTTRLIIPALGLLLLGFMVNIGFATAAIGSLNMISVAFAVLFIGLGVDYAVHMILRFWEERIWGRQTIPAIAAAAHHAGPALALCTVTTSLAFVAFVASDFVGMAQLGIIAAAGIVIAFIASLTLIPAILSLLDITPQEKHLTRTAFLPKPIWQHVKLGTTIFTILVAIAAILLIKDVRFDGDPVNLKDPNSPSVVAFKKILKDQPGEAYAAQLIVEDAQKADQMAARLQQLPSVGDIRWVASFLPARQEAKLELLRPLGALLPSGKEPAKALSKAQMDKALKRIEKTLIFIATAKATSKELSLEATGLRRALLLMNKPEPAGKERLENVQRNLFMQFPALLQQLAKMSQTEPIDVHTIDRDIAKRYVTGDGRWRLEIIPRLDLRNEANLEAFVKEVQAVAPRVTGSAVEIVGAANVVSHAMKQATLVAALLVLIVLLPVLRAITPILLVLTPLVLSALLLLAYTVIFKSPFNFANVIVLPLLLGLGVDSAIHFVMRAHEDGGRHEVVDTTTPRAVLISSLTTIGSFGTLWLSPHKGMSSMGELLTIAIIITLITTLVVLPQLVSWTIGRKSVAKKS